MTDKQFDAVTKRLEHSVSDLRKLSRFQLWTGEAAAAAEILEELVQRMKRRG
jgi:hypothetical protein